MKLAILGANGKAGSAILNEAKRREIDVTAIVRHADSIKDKNSTIIEKDVMQLTSKDIEQFDAVISALGFWVQTEDFIISTKHLVSIFGNQKTRLLIVGGAGSLYVDKNKEIHLSETPDFPGAAKAVATAMGRALKILKHSTNVQWTYLSPAATFDAKGARTGHYVLAGDSFELGANGKSYISYEDYAIAMIDEVEKPKHPNQQFSVHQ